MAQQILRVKADTFLKLRPEQSSGLTPEELHSVRAGTTFELHSYAYADANGSFNGHIKIALKNNTIRGLNTWFVYSLHAQVEMDGEIVYPREDEEAVHILKITRNTVFKRRPLQSTVLSADELFEVVKGQDFRLHSYAYADNQGDFSSHIRVALRSQQDYIRGLSTWYVYDKHAYVEFDGDVVYPLDDPDTPVLTVKENTLFKRRPLASSSLPASETYAVPKGTALKLHSYAYQDAQGNFNNHVRVALKHERDYIQQLSTWYVFNGHAQITMGDRVVYPLPPTTAPAPVPALTPIPAPTPVPSPVPLYRGRSFRLPGNTSTFYTDQPIIPGGSFTWGEATRDATRIPANTTIVNNIIRLARELQKARNQIGRPFLVNSWYRPPAINQAVGGAINSQHLYGSAVDLQIPGFSGRRVANAVMAWWPGGVGIYSNMPDVIHLDVGSRRMWGF